MLIVSGFGSYTIPSLQKLLFQRFCVCQNQDLLIFACITLLLYSSAPVQSDCVPDNLTI